MEQNMGQMCWLGVDENSTKQLHLRRSLTDPWRPYSAFPDLRVPDHWDSLLGFDGVVGSKGWATMQHLRRKGWKLLSTEEGERSIKERVTLSKQ